MQGTGRYLFRLPLYLNTPFQSEYLCISAETETDYRSGYKTEKDKVDIIIFMIIKQQVNK